MKRVALTGALLLAALAFPAERGPAVARAGGDLLVEKLTAMDFIRVRGGTYTRGDFTGRGTNFERPAHPVSVSDFYLARDEVTVAQFRVFAAATGYRTEGERAGEVTDIDPVMRSLVRRPGINWSSPGFNQSEDSPVVWVSWNDAVEFTRWLARATGKPYRLPTEAEWEYAARERGGNLLWSGTNDPERAGDYLWSAENSGGHPHPVGGKTPNALGFHDLTGNVWEWCLDWQEQYAAGTEPVLNPRGPEESRFRALRGGSWRVGRETARTTYRNGYRRDYAHSSIGFRIALDAGLQI